VSASKKIWIISVLAVIGIAGAAWLGRPAWHQFKEKRAMNQARAFLDKGDYPSAILSLRLALTLNSDNLEAVRIMANLADMANSPAALAWRRRIAELEPTLDNKIIFAACALRHEKPPFPIATQALEEIRAPGQTNTAYHLVESQLALKLNRLPEAESHLQTALTLDPTNRFHRLNLATVRLQSTNAAVAVAARAELAKLANDADLGRPALRSLIADALTRKDTGAARDYSTRLQSYTNAEFSDHLLHLSVLNESKSPELSEALSHVQGDCGTNTFQIAQTVSWMSANGQGKPALDWLGTLPQASRNAQPLSLVEADCYLTLKDWSGLELRLAEQRWEEQEFLRLALLSRALREQGRRDTATANWRLAVNAASSRAHMLMALLQLAGAWGWEEETVDLLWAIVKRVPAEDWPLQSLMQTYSANHDSPGMYRVYRALLERKPDSVEAKNNVAMFALLLNRDAARAFELAREVYEADRTNAILASTYAFALHTQGKTDEALKLMQTLEQTDLERPEIATYYAIFLAETGERAAAERYFASAEKGALLPEERRLIDDARRRN
jgi:predicted Zn-dependent protease